MHWFLNWICLGSLGSNWTFASCYCSSTINGCPQACCLLWWYTAWKIIPFTFHTGLEYCDSPWPWPRLFRLFGINQLNWVSFLGGFWGLLYSRIEGDSWDPSWSKKTFWMEITPASELENVFLKRSLPFLLIAFKIPSIYGFPGCFLFSSLNLNPIFRFKMGKGWNRRLIFLQPQHLLCVRSYARYSDVNLRAILMVGITLLMRKKTYRQEGFRNRFKLIWL